MTVFDLEEEDAGLLVFGFLPFALLCSSRLICGYRMDTGRVCMI